MIARTWHGRVRRARSDAYLDFLRRTGFADYRATPGNLGLIALRRDDGDVTHFELVTFWESFDAIRRFAGDEVERARYYPEDDGFLLEKEPFVVHEEVVALNLRAAGGEDPLASG